MPCGLVLKLESVCHSIWRHVTEHCNFIVIAAVSLFVSMMLRVLSENLSASQEITCILWNPKIYYWIHNGLPHVPTLSQIKSMPSHSTFWISILILLSHLRLGLPSGFPTKILYKPLLSLYMPRTFHYSWFGHPHNIWWRVQITKEHWVA